MASEAQGSKARIFFKDGSGVAAWNSGTIVTCPFYRDSMKKIGSVVHPMVITGDRSEHGERARKGPNLYYGQIVFGVSPSDMAFFAPYFMGTTASGTTYALGNTLLPFAVYVDKVTKQYGFYDCYVDKALIIGKQNGPGGPPNYVTLALTIYALSYTNSPATTPTASIPTITGDYVPMIFEDAASAITIQSSARETKEFAILINNFLKQRYVNSLEPSLSYSIHGQVTLQTRHPFDTGTSALDDVALSSSAGGSIVLTNGTVSITWTFGLLQMINQTPAVPGKTEIDIVQNFVSRMTGSTRELVMTIDNTV